jgi:hypothetical protein
LKWTIFTAQAETSAPDSLTFKPIGAEPIRNQDNGTSMSASAGNRQITAGFTQLISFARGWAARIFETED